MDIAMIGLGKMGGNMAERLVRGGHRVLGFDLDAAAVAEAANEGVVTFDSVPEMVAALASPIGEYLNTKLWITGLN